MSEETVYDIAPAYVVGAGSAVATPTLVDGIAGLLAIPLVFVLGTVVAASVAMTGIDYYEGVTA